MRGLREIRLGRLFERRKILGYVDEAMLSVYRDRGVVLKDEELNPNKTAEDRSIYQLVEPGWLVVNRMKAWQGAVGVSDLRGIVSGHYICFLPTHNEVDRYLHYLLRSPRVTAHLLSISRGVRPGQIEIDNDELAGMTLALPDTAEQRRIADFLDDRVARIDRIIASRGRQIALAQTAFFRASYDTVRGAGGAATRPSGSGWLGDIPTSWPMLPVTAEFQVDLGKMLDEKRQTGDFSTPYLRNSNVQWDFVDLEDLKSMDIAPEERSRYTVQPGDLLICEGGQPGRAAVWPGGTEPLGYQKAIHRARSRGRSRSGWLLECLRSAAFLNVFAVENGQTTIGHLTNEQLRAMKFPFPEACVQDAALAELGDVRESTRVMVEGLTRSIGLLTEYKQSLITAAVTGELDVTTTGSGIPG